MVFKIGKQWVYNIIREGGRYRMEQVYDVIMKNGVIYRGLIRGTIGKVFTIKVWNIDKMCFEFYKLDKKDVKSIRRLCV